MVKKKKESVLFILRGINRSSVKGRTECMKMSAWNGCIREFRGLQGRKDAFLKQEVRGYAG